MKIKQYINKLVAIAALVTLVSGVQFNSENGNMTDIPIIIGIEEAYAGPCGRDGCIGGSDKCSTVEIAWGFFKKTCWTTAQPIAF